MKQDTHFLMSDTYDYLMENGQNIGTNFADEFPASWIDEASGTIYLAKEQDKDLFKITMEKL